MVTLKLTSPAGDLAGEVDLRPDPTEVIFTLQEGPDSEALIGEVVGASLARYLGLTEPVRSASEIGLPPGSWIVQVVIALDRARPEGSWTVSLSTSGGFERTAQVDVRDYCSPSPPQRYTGTNPFLFSPTLPVASGWIDEDEPLVVTPEQNCRILPDMTGRPFDEARSVFEGLAQTAEFALEIATGSCGLENESNEADLLGETRPSPGGWPATDGTVTLARTISCPGFPASLLELTTNQYGLSFWVARRIPLADAGSILDEAGADHPGWSWSAEDPNCQTSGAIVWSYGLVWASLNRGYYSERATPDERGPVVEISCLSQT
jgi:hypothetical protein